MLPQSPDPDHPQAPSARERSPRRLSRLLSAHRSFIVVWLALFISIAGIGMVSPLLPVFAEDMGASGIWLGLAFSGFAFSQVPLMPLIGRWSDRIGKKPFLWIGLLVYAAAAGGYIWSPGYHELIAFRVLSGVGTAMVIPTAFAYVGELAPGGYEARYMAVVNLALVAGFGIGPVVGGIVYDAFGMDAAFASMAVSSIAGCGVVLAFLPREARSAGIRRGPKAADRTSPTSGTYVSLMRDETVWGIITFQMVYGLLFGTVLTFVGIWMKDHIGATVSQIGIVLAARVITNGLLSYPFGHMADRVSRRLMAGAALLAVSAGTFSIPWFGGFAALVGLFVAIGICESMAMPSVNAMAVDRGRELGMGAVMGISNMSMSLGLILGSIGGGLIDSALGIEAVFRWTAAAGLIGIVGFNLLMVRRPARR